MKVKISHQQSLSHGALDSDIEEDRTREKSRVLGSILSGTFEGVHREVLGLCEDTNFHQSLTGRQTRHTALTTTQHILNTLTGDVSGQCGGIMSIRICAEKDTI